tara:strand:- start:2132 stop:2515 length:384 start_codon:yes stop_codon:yes gene_type:complete
MKYGEYDFLNEARDEIRYMSVDPFVQIDHRLFRDKRVTPTAKALYGLLKGHCQETWHINLATEAKRHLGIHRDTAGKACQNLEHWGLVQRTKLGTGKVEWTIYSYADSKLAHEVDEHVEIESVTRAV